MERRFLNPAAVSPPRGYSHGVTISGGHTTWVAGQVALDGEGNLVGANDMAEQTRQVFRNLEAVLTEVGATWRDVVKFTFFVTDVSQLDAIRHARDEFIDPDNPPASTLVEVAALVRPEFLIEVEAVVVVD